MGWELNIGTNELQFDVESGCLECEGAVDADCFSYGVLIGVDLVETGGGWDVVIGKIWEEIDMVWKITLDSQTLDYLFVFDVLLRALSQDI